MRKPEHSNARTDVIPRIRTAKRDFYLAYLNSPGWRTRRTRALKLAGYRCQQCGCKRDLQVHHLSYDRLGAEWDQDLEVVCGNCHEAHHRTEAALSDLGVYLRLAAEALREYPFANIADLADETKRLCVRHRVPYDGPHIDRALALVTGRRFIRPARPSPQDPRGFTVPEISASDVHELLTRLGLTTMVRMMPAIARTPAEQRAHEQRLRDQILAVKRGQL